MSEEALYQENAFALQARFASEPLIPDEYAMIDMDDLNLQSPISSTHENQEEAETEHHDRLVEFDFIKDEYEKAVEATPQPTVKPTNKGNPFYIPVEKGTPRLKKKKVVVQLD